MNSFLTPLRTYLAGLSPRESWLLILGVCLLGAIVFDLFLIRPMSARAELAEAKTVQLERDVARGAAHRRRGPLAAGRAR